MITLSIAAFLSLMALAVFVGFFATAFFDSAPWAVIIVIVLLLLAIGVKIGAM
jgi:F0F1-type ATP synthase assembly protein I